MLAALYNYPDMVKILVDAGADEEIINSAGTTAFSYAQNNFIDRSESYAKAAIILSYLHKRPEQNCIIS